MSCAAATDCRQYVTEDEVSHTARPPGVTVAVTHRAEAVAPKTVTEEELVEVLVIDSAEKPSDN
jgi:hypothetical protein